MSKTFELLQQVERERVHTGPAAVPAVVPKNGNGVRRNVINGDEIARLVQRLFRASDGVIPRVVVFAGVEPGGGCTSICAATAETLAAVAPGTFCVVDANFRTPSLHQYFNLHNRVGLADAIVQPGPIRSFAQQVDGSNLWVLPGGSPKAEISALLSSDAMQARMTELRSEFNHVLIDSAALNRCTDAITLGRISDGLLLVLQSNATRRETARNVTEGLKSSNVRLLGAVLNKRTFPIPQNLYNRL
ncbi:MAG TPA: CpsD/CapB family tyrosine-protein kinase [Terriglobales bacterium]|nr:CpsD/CapB family tyrosine-protein kinase [Terriglobales bacterium]